MREFNLLRTKHSKASPECNNRTGELYRCSIIWHWNMLYRTQPPKTRQNCSFFTPESKIKLKKSANVEER